MSLLSVSFFLLLLLPPPHPENFFKIPSMSFLSPENYGYLYSLVNDGWGECVIKGSS